MLPVFRGQDNVVGRLADRRTWTVWWAQAGAGARAGEHPSGAWWGGTSCGGLPGAFDQRTFQVGAPLWLSWQSVCSPECSELAQLVPSSSEHCPGPGAPGWSGWWGLHQTDADHGIHSSGQLSTHSSLHTPEIPPSPFLPGNLLFQEASPTPYYKARGSCFTPTLVPSPPEARC